MRDTPVAVIADAHVQDTTLDFGVRLDGAVRSLRGWQDTATGARAVNESLPAFLAALDEVRSRGIRHVVLLGDYSDDGQVATVARLAEILKRAGELRFYAIPGNHDIFGPHGKHISTRLATGTDRTALVTSDAALAATEAGGVHAPGMFCAGQPQGLMPMAAFGLFRQSGDLHWETPFGQDDAAPARMFVARSADGSVSHRLFDASYLVEPEAGLWLLMLDANVFRPRDGIADPQRKRAFLDPSTAGWNAVLRWKPFLLDWIGDVHRRAAAQGKRLLVFSHYPVIDPFADDGSERAMFGESEVAKRTPLPEVAQRLAVLGVRQHFGGHIHANSVVQAHGVTQVSVPSTSAFPPGFAIAHADRVEVVSLRDTALPSDLRDFYRASGGAPEGRLGPFLLDQLRARTGAVHLPRLFPQGLPPGLDPDLVADWYAIRQAGPLAALYLAPRRLDDLRRLAAEGDAQADPATPDGLRRRFLSMLDLALRRMDGQAAWPAAHPDDHAH